MQPSTPWWIRTALLAAFGFGLFLVLASIPEVVTMLFVAALLAYLFDPLASRLEASGLNRTGATVVVFAGISSIVAVLALLFFPLVAAQVKAVRTRFDQEHARAVIERLELWLEARLAVVGVDDLNLLSSMQQFAVANVDSVLNYVPGVFSLFGQLVIIPFIMFFLIRDGRRIKKRFVSLVPNSHFEFTLNVLHKTDVQLGNYLRGQLIASTIVALLSMTALWLLQVDFFVLIGLFAGLTNMIPYLGPLVGATAAALISVMTTGTLDTILPIVLVFVLIQAIDNVGVQPLVLARKVEMHPLLIVLTLLVAGKYFGMLGLLLGVPAMAVLKVFVLETFRSLRRYRLA